jgi:hypothetical protein
MSGRLTSHAHCADDGQPKRWTPLDRDPTVKEMCRRENTDADSDRPRGRHETLTEADTDGPHG